MSCMRELHWVDWFWIDLKYKGPLIKYERFVVAWCLHSIVLEQKSIFLIARRGQILSSVLRPYFMDELNWKMLYTDSYEVWELKHILDINYF